MEVAFTKVFSKQIDALNNKALKSRLARVVQNVISAETLQDIANLKIMKGHTTAYRIKMGDYRVGLFFEEGLIVFAYLAHRKDIYNKFPS